MATENLNTIFFNGLINRLKAFGYNVSVEHVLQVQSLLLSLPLTEVKLGEVKYIIGPLIAKTKEDQQDIYEIIDDYIEEETSRLAFDEEPIINVLNEKRTLLDAAVQRPADYKIPVFVWAAVIFAVAVTGFIIKVREHNATTHTPAPAAVVDSSQINQIDTSVHVTTIAPVKPITKKKPEKIETGFAVQGLHPIEAKEKNVNLQLSLILGLIAGVVLSFIVFSTKEKEYFTEAESYNKATLKSPGDSNGQDNAPPGNKEEGYDIGLPAQVKFINNNHIIREDKSIAFIKKGMNKYKVGSIPYVDINKSILGSAESGGLYSLQYSYKKEQRKYLILIDVLAIYGHIGKLIDFFIQNLTKDGVYIERYTYQTNILTLADGYRNAISLKELAATRAEFQLFIFGDGKRLVDEASPLPAIPMINLFNTWQQRAIITVVPLADWAYKELQLRGCGFSVVPAEAEGISLLIKSITGKQELDKSILLKHIPSIYSIERFDFTTAESIYAYFDSKLLFQFVCALGIYPRLDWCITLALYKALIKDRIQDDDLLESDYNMLLTVCRLPFLNEQTISDALRLSLLYSLDSRTESIARKTIHACLQEASLSVPVGSPAHEELKTQLLLNEFFMYAHDPKKNKQFAPAKKKIQMYWRKLDDWAMKNYIDQGKGQLMPKNKEGQHLTIQQFMVREGQKEVRRITVLRVLVTMLPAVLIYLFLIAFKPAYAYPGDKELYGQTPIMVKFTKDGCSDTINIIKLSGNIIDNTMYADVSHTNAKEFFLGNMEYGQPVNIEYDLNGLKKTTVIECRDSLYVVTIKNCKGE